MPHEDIDPATVFGAAASAVRAAGPTQPLLAAADWLDFLAEAPTAREARVRASTKELAARRGQLTGARATLLTLKADPVHVAAIERADTILGSWAAQIRIQVQRFRRGPKNEGGA
jgi:hypothetical protein